MRVVAVRVRPTVLGFTRRPGKPPGSSTFSEAAALGAVALVARRGHKLSADATIELYERTQGWAAGLILMLEQSPGYDPIPAPPDLANPQLVFDYLAGEILDKTDAHTRELLLATAYLPQMTAGMAENLTGNAQAGAILTELHRNNYFVALKQAQPQPVYQCHPLMREFLIARANDTFDQAERARLRGLSAQMLVAEGQLTEAAGLLREIEDWQGLVSIIETHAAAVEEHQMVDDREAEPEAATRRHRHVALAKAIEDVRQKRRVDATTGIGDADDGATAGHRDDHVDAAAGRDELHGVGQQIDEHLLQPRGVAVHDGRLVAVDTRERDALGLARRTHRLGIREKQEVHVA